MAYCILYHGLLGLNSEVIFGVGFLVDFRDILDFAVFDPGLNNTDSRVLKFSKNAKMWGPLTHT
jgi:hypothetical protein